jgi:kynurenine/2-aminoadipate aminotransferase
VKHLSDICQWTIPEGGMFMWIKANDVNDTWDMIMKRALDKNVMLVPGKAFMVDQVNTYFIFTYFER